LSSKTKLPNRLPTVENPLNVAILLFMAGKNCSFIVFGEIVFQVTPLATLETVASLGQV
jgi:hypothetical protein